MPVTGRWTFLQAKCIVDALESLCADIHIPEDRLSEEMCRHVAQFLSSSAVDGDTYELSVLESYLQVLSSREAAILMDKVRFFWYYAPWDNRCGFVQSHLIEPSGFDDYPWNARPEWHPPKIIETLGNANLIQYPVWSAKHQAMEEQRRREARQELDERLIRESQELRKARAREQQEMDARLFNEVRTLREAREERAAHPLHLRLWRWFTRRK